MIFIKNATNINQIRELYEEAFPACEKKPFSLITQKRDEGLVEILSIENESGEFLGLAITIINNSIVLLDYFAISEKYRGNGIGSETLELLQKRYPDLKFVLEIESTQGYRDTIDEQELSARIRRKNFYLKNGLTPMPYIIDLFGVEMEVLSNVSDVLFDEYIGLLIDTYGTHIQEKVMLLK